jgi:hypothetical protein
MNFMQLSLMIRTFVPYIAFIDRKGMIRMQLTGSDFTDETLEKVLREDAEKLVNEPTGPPKPRAKRSSGS